jgi:hypothetical protein
VTAALRRIGAGCRLTESGAIDTSAISDVLASKDLAVDRLRVKRKRIFEGEWPLPPEVCVCVCVLKRVSVCVVVWGARRHARTHTPLLLKRALALPYSLPIRSS